MMHVYGWDSRGPVSLTYKVLVSLQPGSQAEHGTTSRECNCARQATLTCHACAWLIGRRDSLAVSLSAFSRDPPLLMGCSLMSTAAADTTRGNAAVSRKTPRGPHVSIRDPEK